MKTLSLPFLLAGSLDHSPEATWLVTGRGEVVVHAFGGGIHIRHSRTA